MTDTRLAAIGVETLTNGDPAARLAATGVEALTTVTPGTRLGAIGVEVLVPRIAPRRGWGIPMTPTS